MKVAIYARVSSKAQMDHGTSLQHQIDFCTMYARSQGYDVVGIFYEDHPGEYFDRPQMDKVRQLAKQGLIDAVLVYNRDRYGRGKAAPAMLDTFFAQHAVKVINLQRPDSNPDAAYIQDGVEDLFSGYENRKRRERTMSGKRQAVEQNRVLQTSGGLFGYASVGDRQKDSVIDHTIISDIPGLETKPRVIQWIFEQYVIHNRNAHAIARMLNEYRISTQLKTRWDATKVRKILTQQGYTGVFVRFKEKAVPTERRNSQGKIIRVVEQRDQSEWITIVREDLAIISTELFDAAKAKLEKGRGAIGTEEYLLSRRLRCEHTIPYAGKTKKRESGYKHKTYVLNPGFRLTRCNCHTYIAASMVDNAVWSWVMDLVSDTERVLRTYLQLQQDTLAKHTDAIETVQGFDTAIKQAEDELSYLIDEAREHRNNPRVKERYRQLIKDQEGKLDALVAERNRLALPLEDKLITDEYIQQTVQYLNELSIDRDALQTLPLSDKKALLEDLGVQVILLADHSAIDIVWYGQVDRFYLKDHTSSRRVFQVPLTFRIPLSKAA